MRPELPTITIPRAERHEALWLRLHALQKDICAIAAKKPEAPVGESERIVAESLIRDCRPFLTKPIDAMPVAALHYAGLAIQLGQFLARLDDFENRHAYWDPKRNGRVWRVVGEPVPIARLHQELTAYELKTFKGRNLREELAKLIRQKDSGLYEEGFAAGRAARLGPPPVQPGAPRDAKL